LPVPGVLLDRHFRVDRRAGPEGGDRPVDEGGHLLEACDDVRPPLLGGRVLEYDREEQRRAYGLDGGRRVRLDRADLLEVEQGQAALGGDDVPVDRLLLGQGPRRKLTIERVERLPVETDLPGRPLRR